MSARSDSDAAKRLKGRVAVITSSTYGVGFAIASKLAHDGAKVMLCSRQQPILDEAVATLQKQYGQDNVSGVLCRFELEEGRRKLIHETAATFGGIDILVSASAAMLFTGLTLQTPESIWIKTLSLNVTALAMLVKEAYPYLKKSKCASIVLLSSITGYHPYHLTGAYAVSRTATLGLTKVLATELANDNIRVNCIAAGVTKIKLSEEMRNNEKTSTQFMEKIPLQRFAEPDDHAGTVSFLCSDDASYITGETVTVAGGWSSRL